MKRRTFLTASIATGSVVALAGCSSTSNDNPGGGGGGGGSGLDDVEPDPDQLPAPSLGSGSITLEVFEDFSCPHCHTFKLEHFPTVESELIDTDEITYHHVDFPLPVNGRSVPKANAARAVQADTMTDDAPAGAFFEYQKLVYESSADDDDTLIDYAADVGADPDAVESALEEGTYLPTLAADRERGVGRGVESTPTGILDGDSSYSVSAESEVDSLIEDVRNS